MVLYILVFFAAIAPIIVYLSLNYFRTAIEKSVEDQQFMLVTRIADEIDQKIRFSQDALKSSARTLNPHIIDNPVKASEFLDNQLALLSIFDNGLFLFDSKGSLISDTTNSPGRIGMDFSYREYIKRTIDTRKPVISNPYRSSLPHHHPVVMFTVPFFDEKGTFTAILGGSIDLMKENYLGALSKAKIGKEGFFFLTSPDRMLIMHPDTSSIMTTAQPGRNPLHDRALDGFEGSGTTVSDSGAHGIAAFKRLATTGWILAANFPEKEALSPIRKASWFAWSMVFFGGLLTVSAFWLVTRQLISPLISITEQIRRIHSQQGQHRQVEISTNDEIRELATVFNTVITGLDEKEKTLTVLNDELELRVVERTERLAETNNKLQQEIRNRDAAREEIICLNEDLNRRALSLETINRELESFSYSISHDLQAPIRHIKGYISILKEDHSRKFDESVMLLFNKVASSSNRLEQLVTDILDLSRVSRSQIRAVPVNLSTIAEEIKTLLVETDPGRNVVFTIETEVMVTGDPVLLHLVMQNLLENSWKYCVSKESALIRFGKIQSDAETTCFVSDNGIGFDMAHAEKIFGVFQRLHSSSEYEGTGIGLATVQRILHRHNGRIWAEGKAAEGATFYFTIPTAAPSL